MGRAGDHAVTTSDCVFHFEQDTVAQRFGDAHRRLERLVAELSDDDALALDPAKWGRGVAPGLEIAPPRPRTKEHEFTEEGAVDVDCTHWPGVTHTLSEMATGVLRAGFRFRVTVPGDGDLSLLQTRLSGGGEGLRATLGEETIIREYRWPRELPAEELQEDVDRFLRALEAGADELAGRIAAENARLAGSAADLLARRQEEIRASRTYLGGLRLTVTRDPRADTSIPALPQRVPAAGGPASATPPTADTRGAGPAPISSDPAPPIAATLNEFYDHVVTVIGVSAVGFERTPRPFAAAQEEDLRDFILVTLNSHYEGTATGETFNGDGKTDILVRHGMDNAFIGECKIWSGESKLEEAFEQLLGYTTWRDNRLALIFFVRNRNLAPVIATTRAFLEATPEFGAWEPETPEGQLRCTLRWEDEARKEARLTVFFVHLPRE